MIVVTSVAGMQRRARKWRREGIRVGFVPTMGYLHAGHLSLIRRARRLVGAKGRVVVSIYVNPAQFGPTEDFRCYPRDSARDRALCRRGGVDLLFAPDDAQMYVEGREWAHSTYVVEEELSREMEGRSRPTHFRGVTTVVAKLFNLVLPEVAVFGAKDYQQGVIIRRMVRDLNFPVRVVMAHTVREPDGLALSSRNAYLKGPLRVQAVALSEAIRWVRARLRAGRQPAPAGGLRRLVKQRIERQPDAKVDYIQFLEPETLRPGRRVKPGMQMALAVFVGGTRLIDSGPL